MSKVKTVGYAYPTSPIAAYRGASKAGCWYLAVFDEGKPLHERDVIYSAENKRDVLSMVNSLVPESIAWGKYSMHEDVK
jgi:hypothetical protein